MATARKEKIPVPECKIILELTEKETEILYGVTCRIGGHPDTTNRKYIDNIRLALKGLIKDPFTDGDSIGLTRNSHMTFD
jgi:hypothetical protein